MAEQFLGNPSQHRFACDASSTYIPGGPQLCTRKWYFSKHEIEELSPSRKDGIDLSEELHLQKLYCLFLQDLGKTLKVPQLTIATAIMLCHRFYMRQSHRKNDWQTVGTVSMFLACKVEETPRLLRDVVVVAYEMIYKWDPSAPRRIRQRDTYDIQKQLILSGERLLLTTIAFDLNIEHPYKPLVAAVKRLGVSHKDLVQVAWNFVNDWLCTTLCLQYKPHYIAAGSLFLAAKFHKVKLPVDKGKVWWLQFDVSPKHLEEVIQKMLNFLENSRKQTLPPSRERVLESTKKAIPHSSRLGILNESIALCEFSNDVVEETGGSGESIISKCSQDLIHAQVRGHCQTTVNGVLQGSTSDCSSTNSVIEDDDDRGIQRATTELDHNMSCNVISVHGPYGKLNTKTISEATKMKRCGATKRSFEVMQTQVHRKVCIDSKLEIGAGLGSAPAKKIPKVL